MKVTLPLRTVNPLNNRRHWRVVSTRSRKERWLAYCGLVSLPAHLYIPPFAIQLTRLAPRMMDDDGLAASFKAVRDGIADRLCVNDGSDKIAFKYAQRKSKQYGVEIEFTELRA